MSTPLAAAVPASTQRIRPCNRHALPVCIAVGVLVFAVARSGYYSARSDLGYWLGVAGGSAMLLLLLYPVSKRFPRLRALVPARYWFAGHMLLGVFGPVLILMHCTFRIGSTNAAVALWSMVVVASSGVVGRFVYGRLHAGMYGRQRSFAEVAKGAEASLAEAGARLRQAPEVLAELRRFAEFANCVADAGLRRPLALFSMDLAARACVRRCRQLLAAARAGSEADAEAVNAERVMSDYLRAARDAAQFRAFERVFALWHVLHIPLVLLLVVTAALHVVAVHMY